MDACPTGEVDVSGQCGTCLTTEVYNTAKRECGKSTNIKSKVNLICDLIMDKKYIPRLKTTFKQLIHSLKLPVNIDNLVILVLKKNTVLIFYFDEYHILDACPTGEVDVSGQCGTCLTTEVYNTATRQCGKKSKFF